jgi:glycosidase
MIKTPTFKNTGSKKHLMCFLLPVVIFCLFIKPENTHAQPDTGTTHWWNDAVFYEVFVRSFKDSDGDGNGDIKGLIEKLDYLNDGNPATHDDLGITAIWLMPIQQSPSYHGYDVVDYRTIEEDYGTNEDFKLFIEEAHNRGIKVIIDYVMNHTSSAHPWFLEALQNPASEKRAWYRWENTKPSLLGPWGQAVWHTKSANHYYGVFWSEMPDLNYATPAVKDEMFDIAKFWLEEMKVDGFRLDAVKYIFEDGTVLEDTPETIDFWKEFRSYYKSIRSDALAVGEAWTNTAKIKPYVDNNGLDFCFEFDLADAILKAANTGNTNDLTEKMDEVIASYPYLQFGTFLTNHDINRVMDYLKSNSKAKVAADLLLTLPGIPYIYYGEEIGMQGSKPDENIRRPMQWTSGTQAGFTNGTPWRAVHTDYTNRNVQEQQQDETSLWHRYRRLIALRNNYKALRKGTYASVATTATAAFAFSRQYEEEKLLIVTNTSSPTLSDLEAVLNWSDLDPGNYALVGLQGEPSIAVTIEASGILESVSIAQLAGRTTAIYKLMKESELHATVRFEVDMNDMINAGLFDPLEETVDIVATFNDFGQTLTRLDDSDQDGIYSIEIPEIQVGEKIEYKYRINGVEEGREEYPGTSYLRHYFVLEGIHTVSDRYKNEILTSVSEWEKNIVQVYPVPASEELTVQLASDFGGSIHYTISDVLGRVRVATSPESISEEKTFAIPCGDIEPGVYILTLIYEGRKEVVRIVLQK